MGVFGIKALTGFLNIIKTSLTLLQFRPGGLAPILFPLQLLSLSLPVISESDSAHMIQVDANNLRRYTHPFGKRTGTHVYHWDM